MYTWLKGVSLALIGIAAMGMAHDFHVSRLSIDYHPEKGRLAMTLHTFVDDLELALEKQHGLSGPMARSKGLPHMGELDLATPTEHRLTDSLVEDYLRKRIQLEVGGRQLKWTYLGKEPGPDPYSLFLYFSAEQLPGAAAVAVKDNGAKANLGAELHIQVRSTFMTDLYDDQQNVVIWQRNGEAEEYDLLTGRSALCAQTF